MKKKAAILAETKVINRNKYFGIMLLLLHYYLLILLLICCMFSSFLLAPQRT